MPKTRDSFPPTSATANLSVTPKSQTKPRVTNITMSKRPIRDRFFVGNYYCCDGCREAPLDPDPMQRNTSLVKLIRKDFYFYLTIVLIISVNVLFILLVAPYLVEHIGIIVLVISQVLFAQIILFLLATACTDPGILPRALDAEALAVQQEIIKDNKSQEKLDQKSQPPTKVIWINGQMIQFKYCYTCRFFRPPRSIHCSVCNRCIDRFDHHCPWISNCVGRRNYRSFFMFLLTLSSYMIFTSACELAFLILVAQKHGLHRTFRQHPVIFVMLAMALVSLWSVVGLTGFHVFLSCTNLTTNEDIKQAYVAEVFDNNNELILNPFTEGSPYLNCQRTLCESRPKTFLKKINK